MSGILHPWGDIAKGTILVLLDFFWQSSFLIAAVCGGMKLFRIRGASTRHFLLVCALLGVGVLPLVNVVWTRVGVARFSVRSMSEEGSQVVRAIGRAVFRHEEGGTGEDRAGGDRGETVERTASSSDVAGSSGTASETGEDARVSPPPWFGTMVRRVGPPGYAFLFGIWVSGVLFGLFRVFWGYRTLRGVRASCRPVEDASVLAAYGEALEAANLRTRPRLFASDRIPAPMAVGVLDPAVLVPDTLGETLSTKELKMVLLHELLHVKRHDLLIGLYQRLLDVVCFFHPLIRYLNRRIGRACEDRCDGLVLERTGAPAAYARALTEILGRARAYPRTSLLAGAGLHCRSRLALRIRGILDGLSAGPMPRWGVPAGAIATCLLVGLASCFTMLGGSEAPPGTGNVSLSGIVRDSTGVPVEGATVYAFRGGGSASWGKAATTTDGRFTIDGLILGTFTAVAEAKGYAPAVLLDVPGGARDLEFVLSEGGAIAGRVVSEEGVPAPEVMVTAKYHSGVLHSVWARTDENGMYRIPNLAEGVYRVRVNVRYSPSVYGRWVADPRGSDRIVRVREGRMTTGVDFLLTPGRRVSGHMTYRETGRSAAGVPVTLMGQDRMDTVTDEEGRYAFSGVPPGRYWVTTDLAGYAGMTFHRSFDVTMEEDARDVDVALIRKGALSVVVRDEEGDPISGARVRYGGAKALYGMREPSEGRTDREGRCRFEGVCTEWPEPEMLWVDHPEYAFGLLPVEPIGEGEDRKIEVKLSRGGTLKGRVTDWGGKPVSGARIRIFGPAEYPGSDPNAARTAFTDRRGEYRAERLPPGALKVVVDHARPLFVPETSTVEIREGEITRWDVSVRRGGTLVGRVVDRRGRPVKGIEIDISPWGFYLWEIRTDEEGFYRADHLPPKEYSVSVRMPYHSWRPGGEKKRAHVAKGGVARVDLVVESDGGGHASLRGQE